MTDDLVKRLRDMNGGWASDEALAAADRVEELQTKLAEQIEWVKSLADDLIAAEGREARLKDKLAKAVQFTKGVIRHAGNSGDDYLAEQARATLADLKGGYG